MVGVVPAHELPLAGRFPDMSGSTPPGMMRWWDGNTWTVDLKPQVTQPLPCTQSG
jgi:hypothetical protein